MDKKWMILIGFFSAFTLISSIVSTSIVFMNDETRTEVNSNKVLPDKNIYKNTSIVYDENNHLNISSIDPGYSLEQKFRISNNNSNQIKYSIEWQNVTSTWNEPDARPAEFTYTLNCSNGEKVISKQMPLSNEVILDDLELTTNKTNECIITFSFVNTEQDQSYNLNKSFIGTYKVIVKE